MPQFYGYDFHGRQQGIVLRHAMRAGDASIVPALDAWFGRFGLKPDEGVTLSQPSADNAVEVARAVCERGLLLYRELARTSRLPVFARGEVLHVRLAEPAEGSEAQPGSCEVTVRLPAVDSFLPSLFIELYHDVLRLIARSMTGMPTDEAVVEVETAIREQWREKAQRALPFVDSDMHLCRIAFEHDIPFRHLGHGVTQIGWGRRSRLLQNGSIEQDSSAGSRIAADKMRCAQVLAAAGFPATENILATNIGAATEAAKALGWPVVVKPLSLSRSAGVTTGIQSEEALQEAFALASALHPQVLVERHVPGRPHRIAIADGKLVYAVARYPKGVRGDGQRAVGELIEAENLRRAAEPAWKRFDPLPTDEQAVQSLAAMGMTFDSVPSEGEVALLRPMHGGEWGGFVIDVADRIHPDNVKLAADVAELLGLKFAGIDLMSADISVPWYENDARINEVNFRPQFATANRKIDVSGVVSALAEGDGRIPVHLVAGSGDLLGHARSMAAKVREQGRSCFVTGKSVSEDGSGETLHVTAQSLFDRSIAILLRKDVDELILVDEDEELFTRSFPVDRLQSLQVIHPDPAERQRLAQRFDSRISIGVT